jgi:hypothetical protein
LEGLEKKIKIRLAKVMPEVLGKDINREFLEKPWESIPGRVVAGV